MSDIEVPALCPRRATASDLERFSDFDCGDEDYQRELTEFLRTSALSEGASRYNTTYVFYDQGRPLAFVALACASIDTWGEASANAWNVPALLIEMLAVDRRNQQRGVGAAILGWVRDLADNLGVGCRFLALYCDERNHAARRFYRRHGFFEPPLPPEGYGERLMLYDLAS